MDDTRMEVDTATQTDRQYQHWLQAKIVSHVGLRKSDSSVSSFVQAFLHQIQAFHVEHGNLILSCRGQQRTLLSQAQLRQQKSKASSSSLYSHANWFDFVQLGEKSRLSGPVLPNNSKDGIQQQRRFETFSLKVQASREKARFGMTDDTGYLFPCLQHYVPRACFFVVDHLAKNVFLLHGNKKFAGQGDDTKEEEGTTSSNSANANSTGASSSLHNPSPKCFPGTEHLQPSYYIFTWKANGKNSGVFGYKDPINGDNGSDDDNTPNIWLFVNSKGVCECGGLLEDALKDPSHATNNNWSDIVKMEPPETSLLPQICQSFVQIWNHPTLQKEIIYSLWDGGYLLLFEFCDNKHVVLERGKDGHPVDHLAFIGLVKQPPLKGDRTTRIDTYHTGLEFKVDDTFSFDLWRRLIQAPTFSSKPTLYVPVEALGQATKELMKGTLFRDRASSSFSSDKEGNMWFNPNNNSGDGSAFLTGEGAVCYEMATDESGETVIRQLFKAKTASYITHRQFRGFLSKTRDEGAPVFEEYHTRVNKFCRRKFGDLNPESPYPDLKAFCQDPPSTIVEAASLYYAHFGVWLQERASKLNTTVATLVGFVNPDILVSLESDMGKEYQREAELIGLPTGNSAGTIAIRCGIAFRLAEFSHVFGLQHAKVFAAPREILREIRELEKSNSFSWKSMPTGYNGTMRVGFSHVFPEGVASNAAMDKETRKLKKSKRKKQKTKGPSVLSPFHEAFKRFLWANPGVKLTIGSREENPEFFTLSSEEPDNDTILSCPTMGDFQERLSKLPRLEQSAQHMDQSQPGRVLTEENAVAQAVDVLQTTFPAVQNLFQRPIDLTFGDVFGSIVPIITLSDSKHYILIIRGFPGLGKSTIAKALQHVFGTERVTIIEADSYFGPTCPFNPDLLQEAHQDAKCRAQEALEKSETQLVVVSNTSTVAWEYASYIRLAQASNAPVSVAILTLDTKASFSDIDNIHSVPDETVQKMALRLRLPDNNPEGKSLDQIFAVADRQAAKIRVVQDPVLIWSLLGNSGLSTIDEIWETFVSFAISQNIMVSSAAVRPTNLHVTQLYVRPSSPKEDLVKISSLWDQHGAPQTMRIGEIRFGVKLEGEQTRFVNIAVKVESLSPELVDVKTPHITIAYDPERAKPADSKTLWDNDDQPPQNVRSTSVFEYQPRQIEFSCTLEVGLCQKNQIFHRYPEWVCLRALEG